MAAIYRRHSHVTISRERNVHSQGRQELCRSLLAIRSRCDAAVISVHRRLPSSRLRCAAAGRPVRTRTFQFVTRADCTMESRRRHARCSARIRLAHVRQQSLVRGEFCVAVEADRHTHRSTASLRDGMPPNESRSNTSALYEGVNRRGQTVRRSRMCRSRRRGRDHSAEGPAAKASAVPTGLTVMCSAIIKA